MIFQIDAIAKYKSKSKSKFKYNYNYKHHRKISHHQITNHSNLVTPTNHSNLNNRLSNILSGE